jgi:hypothetical protein
MMPLPAWIIGALAGDQPVGGLLHLFQRRRGRRYGVAVLVRRPVGDLGLELCRS